MIEIVIGLVVGVVIGYYIQQTKVDDLEESISEWRNNVRINEKEVNLLSIELEELYKKYDGLIKKYDALEKPDLVIKDGNIFAKGEIAALSLKDIGNN